jgi:hypothetical protein
MKHATASALEALGDLLVNLSRPGLVENRQGIFYLKAERFCIFMRSARGFLPICGKVAIGGVFPVNSSDELTTLLETINRSAQARD